MSKKMIRVDGLGKKYLIGHRVTERYDTLRDAISRKVRNAGRMFRDGLSGLPMVHGDTVEEFWALRDVNFEVEQGDVVGIIGRNGAGKSTLLKILSRITEPTTGRVKLEGRVGSLLEVGTGFHPELTGRENIFLNGAILGMSRREIQQKFDEIVAFAGVERFIDTPVKRYSSGMYVRLAFSVAAHLEPEILIIDEVLAVGDAAFQSKCLGKMKEVSGNGRTVLFVSHNLAAVQSLCHSAIYIKDGEVATVGTTSEVVRQYVSREGGDQDSWVRPDTAPIKLAGITNASLTMKGAADSRSITISMDVKGSQGVPRAFFAIDIKNELDETIMQALPNAEPFFDLDGMSRSIDIDVDLPPLIPGKYRVSLWMGAHNTSTLDEWDAILTFSIDQSPTPGRTFPHTPDHGYIVPNSRVVA